MSDFKKSSPLPLPKGWKQQIKSTILQVMALARFTVNLGQSQADERKDGNPFEVCIARLEAEITRLKESMRIKDQRMRRISAIRRPHFTPMERLQILELRAVSGWSRRQTARKFLVSPATISSWLKRADEGGQESILATTQPVNKFPDLVSYSVQRLKTLCPNLGKTRIAQLLCRAGLHLGTTTVGRILKEQPKSNDSDPQKEPDKETNSGKNEINQTEHSDLHAPPSALTATYPNQIWHVDLTAVPIGGGFWTTWSPFALPQCWPFCWWVAIVMDHYSRKVMGFAVFKQQPTAVQVRTFLGRAMSRAKKTQPKYIVSDKGSQFWCGGYKKWCKRKRIKPRFGAIGQHGSIALIERLNRTFKEFTRSLAVVPMVQSSFRTECVHFFDWYNEHRPHSALGGNTPNEIYFKEKYPANRRPRLEPREKWPRGSPCAKPQVLVAGQPGDRFKLEIDFYQGNRHLPVVKLNRAA